MSTYYFDWTAMPYEYKGVTKEYTPCTDTSRDEGLRQWCLELVHNPDLTTAGNVFCAADYFNFIKGK